MAQGNLKKFRTDTHKYKAQRKRWEKYQGRLEAERIDKERILICIQDTKL